MKRIFTSHSPAETEREAERLAGDFSGCETVAMFGDLGAGKTAFIRGLAKGLGVDPSEVSSPTFAIMHDHTGTRNGVETRLCHYDMYRVNTWDDLDSTGFPESVGRCVNAVEWSENIENALPYPRWEIRIERGDSDDERVISIELLEEEG